MQMRRAENAVRPLIVALGVLLGGGTATAGPVDWSRDFVLAGSGGLDSPLVEVAFNPQPEPPAGGLLTFGPPPMPSYPPDPVIVHTGDFQPGTPFRLLFGIANGMELAIPDASVAAGPGADGLLSFDVLAPSGNQALTRGARKVFEVQLALATTSGGSPLDWQAFNPQPEPPALGPGAAAFGADFSFSSFSDVSLAVRVLDAEGAPLTLTSVSEPGSLALLGMGLAVAAVTRRRRTPPPARR